MDEILLVSPIRFHVVVFRSVPTPRRLDFMGDMVYVSVTRHTTNTTQTLAQFHALLQHHERR